MTSQPAPKRGTTVRTRNRTAILESAKLLLARDPGASMEDVASAAGVVRRTVYGHFANRTELLTAIVRTSIDDFLSIVGLQELDDRPADEALAAVVLRVWSTAHAAWPLVALSRRTLPKEVERSMLPFHQRVARILQRGQEEGTFATHLAPRTLAMMVDALAFAFLEARAAQSWHGDERDVAVAVLIALGVPQQAAERAVQRSTLHP